MNSTSTPGEFTLATYDLGAAPFEVVAVDLQDKGYASDLVVTTRYDHSYIALLNNNDDPTTFTVGSQLRGSSGADTRGVASGDFNGDGEPDLVIGNEDGVSILLNRNDGSGSFGTPSATYRTSDNSDNNAEANAVRVADLNHDGFLDVVTANRWGENFSVLFGNGDGTFGTSHNYPANNPRDLVLGDWDNDGNTDVAIGSISGGVYIMYGTSGVGKFTLPGDLTIPGDLTLTSGTLDPEEHTINLAGNLSSDKGLLSGDSGLLNLTGGDQTISGNNIFYDLAKSVTSAHTLTFERAKNFVIAHTITLAGTSGNLLSLRSDHDTFQWHLDPEGIETFSYLNVKDSDNLREDNVFCTAGCIDSGNNTGWSFADNPTPTPTPTPHSHSSGGGATSQRVRAFVAPSITQTPGASSPFTRSLKKGMSGDDVKKLQVFLNTHGFVIALTGPGSSQNETNYFGDATQTALIKFQIANNINPPSGFFGPITTALFEKLSGISPTSSTSPISPTAPTTLGTFTRDLEKGMKGDDVTSLQKLLISLHVGPAADALAQSGASGYFGDLTKSALTEFQKAKGVTPPAGYFGPKTKSVLK